MVVSRILNGFYVLYGIPRNVTFQYLKSLAKANGFELKRPTQQVRGGEVNVLESLLQIITIFVAHLLYEKTLHLQGTALQYKRQQVVLHHSPLLLLDSPTEPVVSPPLSELPVLSGLASLLPIAVATEEMYAVELAFTTPEAAPTILIKPSKCFNALSTLVVSPCQIAFSMFSAV